VTQFAAAFALWRFCDAADDRLRQCAPLLGDLEALFRIAGLSIAPTDDSESPREAQIDELAARVADLREKALPGTDGPAPRARLMARSLTVASPASAP